MSYLVRLSALAFSLALTSGTALAAPATSTTCTRLVVTGHPSYAPVSWAAGSTLQGGALMLVRRLAEDAGIPISIINSGSWAGAQEAVKAGKADLIVGIYKTPARQEFLSYVEPAIAQDPSAIIVKAGSTLPYKDWNSLVGKKGLMSAGESYGAKFDAFRQSKLTVEQVNGFPAVVDAVGAGNADYGLMGYYAALTEAPKDKVAISVKSFVSEPMYIAFGKQSPCKALAASFARGIKAATLNGTVSRLWTIGLADYAASKR